MTETGWDHYLFFQLLIILGFHLFLLLSLLSFFLPPFGFLFCPFLLHLLGFLLSLRRLLHRHKLLYFVLWNLLHIIMHLLLRLLLSFVPLWLGKHNLLYLIFNTLSQLRLFSFRRVAMVFNNMWL